MRKGTAFFASGMIKKKKKTFTKPLRWQESRTTDVKFGMVAVELERRGHELPMHGEVWDLWQ